MFKNKLIGTAQWIVELEQEWPPYCFGDVVEKHEIKFFAAKLTRRNVQHWPDRLTCCDRDYTRWPLNVFKISGHSLGPICILNELAIRIMQTTL